MDISNIKEQQVTSDNITLVNLAMKKTMEIGIRI